MTSEAGKTIPDPSTGTDEIITAALIQGLSYPEAGKLAGVSAKTVQRRMADPTFAAQVTAGRLERASDITARLTDLSLKAVAVLDEAMDEDQPMGCRLTAAGASLRHLREYRINKEIDDRLREIEAIKEPVQAIIDMFGTT
ncbi:MAG: hypothetical protein U0P45_12630 [Acidimicrobiales bacterium]